MVGQAPWRSASGPSTECSGHACSAAVIPPATPRPRSPPLGSTSSRRDSCGSTRCRSSSRSPPTRSGAPGESDTTDRPVAFLVRAGPERRSAPCLPGTSVADRAGRDPPSVSAERPRSALDDNEDPQPQRAHHQPKAKAGCRARGARTPRAERAAHRMKATRIRLLVLVAAFAIGISTAAIALGTSGNAPSSVADANVVTSQFTSIPQVDVTLGKLQRRAHDQRARRPSVLGVRSLRHRDTARADRHTRLHPRPSSRLQGHQGQAPDATASGLDVAKFDADRASSAVSARRRAGRSPSRAYGFRGTPSFTVSGPSRHPDARIRRAYQRPVVPGGGSSSWLMSRSA